MNTHAHNGQQKPNMRTKTQNRKETCKILYFSQYYMYVHKIDTALMDIYNPSE